MIDDGKTECCPTEPYIPPTLKDEAQARISQLAREITNQNKILIFLNQFPQAAKYLNENGLFLYIR